MTINLMTKQDANKIKEDALKKATLSLDFVNNKHRVYEQYGLVDKVITDVVTTIRTSDATYINTNGNVVSQTNNLPRITHDPVTGERLGLLAEEQRTNLLLHSQYTAASGATPATGWTFAQSTATTTTVSSSRTSGAIRVTHTGTLKRGVYEQTRSLLASTTYTFSVYFAAGTIADNRVMRVQTQSGDTPTGTILLEGSSVTSAGVYSITFTTGTIGGNYSILVGLGCTGDATGTVIHETPQLEVGAFPTSYIPTTTAQVTRIGEKVTAQSSNSTSGTAFIEGIFANDISSGFRGLVAHLNGTNYFGLNIPSNTQTIRLQTVPLTSTVITTGNIPFGSRFKAAYRWTPAQLTLAVNGAIIGSQSHSGLITPNVIGIRLLSESGLALNKDICSFICEIPRALTDIELIALTR